MDSVTKNGFVSMLDVDACRKVPGWDWDAINGVKLALSTIDTIIKVAFASREFITLHDIEQMVLQHNKLLRKQDGSPHESFESLGFGSMVWHPAVRDAMVRGAVEGSDLLAQRGRPAPISGRELVCAIMPGFQRRVTFDMTPEMLQALLLDLAKAEARMLLQGCKGFEDLASDTEVGEKELLGLLGFVVPKPGTCTFLRGVVRSVMGWGATKCEACAVPKHPVNLKTVLRAYQEAAIVESHAYAREQLLDGLAHIVDTAELAAAIADRLTGLKEVQALCEQQGKQQGTSKKQTKKERKKERKETKTEVQQDQLSILGVIRFTLAPLVAAVLRQAEPARVLASVSVRRTLEGDKGRAVVEALVATATTDLHDAWRDDPLCCLRQLELQLTDLLGLRNASLLPLTFLDICTSLPSLYESITTAMLRR